MPKGRIRVRLKSYDSRVIDDSAEEILDTAIRTGAKVAGPVPLPRFDHPVAQGGVRAHRPEVAEATRQSGVASSSQPRASPDGPTRAPFRIAARAGGRLARGSSKLEAGGSFPEP